MRKEILIIFILLEVRCFEVLNEMGLLEINSLVENLDEI